MDSLVAHYARYRTALPQLPPSQPASPRVRGYKGQQRPQPGHASPTLHARGGVASPRSPLHVAHSPPNPVYPPPYSLGGGAYPQSSHPGHHHHQQQLQPAAGQQQQYGQPSPGLLDPQWPVRASGSTVSLAAAPHAGAAPADEHDASAQFADAVARKLGRLALSPSGSNLYAVGGGGGTPPPASPVMASSSAAAASIMAFASALRPGALHAHTPGSPTSTTSTLPFAPQQLQPQQQPQQQQYHHQYSFSLPPQQQPLPLPSLQHPAVMMPLTRSHLSRECLVSVATAAAEGGGFGGYTAASASSPAGSGAGSPWLSGMAFSGGGGSTGGPPSSRHSSSGAHTAHISQPRLAPAAGLPGGHATTPLVTGGVGDDGDGRYPQFHGSPLSLPMRGPMVSWGELDGGGGGGRGGAGGRELPHPSDDDGLLRLVGGDDDADGWTLASPAALSPASRVAGARAGSGGGGGGGGGSELGGGRALPTTPQSWLAAPTVAIASHSDASSWLAPPLAPPPGAAATAGYAASSTSAAPLPVGYSGFSSSPALVGTLSAGVGPASSAAGAAAAATSSSGTPRRVLPVVALLSDEELLHEEEAQTTSRHHPHMARAGGLVATGGGMQQLPLRDGGDGGEGEAGLAGEDARAAAAACDEEVLSGGGHEPGARSPGLRLLRALP